MSRKLESFASWAALLSHVANVSQYVFYHAPLDHSPRRVMVTKVCKNGKVRIDPLSNDADKFTADEGRLDRFRFEAPVVPIGLGDIVSHGWSDGYADGTVCTVHADGTVDVFRVYVHAAGFSCAGGEDGSSAVICYTGSETTKRIDPSKLKLLRKGQPLK